MTNEEALTQAPRRWIKCRRRPENIHINRGHIHAW
jgi:hypothetical protein